MTSASRLRRGSLLRAIGLVLIGGIVSADETATLRVDSEVFVNGGKEPAARSLTLFDNGVTWDFLEPLGGTPGDDEAGDPAGDGAPFSQIVLHDPMRERVILLDPQRQIKTHIDTIRLERLSVSLAKWARSSDDKLVRWAGGPDFGSGITQADGHVELSGPRTRYAVDFTAAPRPEAAAAYRRFADTAILLKALLQPGGVPPFPRLAINRRIEAAGGIPTQVMLHVDGRMPMLPKQSDTLRSVHKVHPQLTDEDRSRIDDAAALVAIAEAVDLAEFISRRAESIRPSAPDS